MTEKQTTVEFVEDIRDQLIQILKLMGILVLHDVIISFLDRHFMKILIMFLGIGILTLVTLIVN